MKWLRACLFSILSLVFFLLFSSSDLENLLKNRVFQWKTKGLDTQAFTFFGPQRLDGHGNERQLKQPTWGASRRSVLLEGICDRKWREISPKVLEAFGFI